MSWYLTLPNPLLPLIKGCNVVSVTEHLKAHAWTPTMHHVVDLSLISSSEAQGIDSPKSPLVQSLHTKVVKIVCSCVNLILAAMLFLSISLIITHFLVFLRYSALFCFGLKKSADTLTVARPPLSALFLTFLWWEGGRVKSRDHVETAALPALSLFFYVHLLLSLLSVLPSRWPSLLLLFSFYFSFFFF